MTTVNDFIDVSITRETRVIQRASFTIPCFVAEHTVFTERAKEFNSLTEITAIGFTSTSNVYKAAQRYFAQNVSPEKVIIGRRQVPSIVFTPTVADSAVYTLKINGYTVTFTSDASATAAEIVTGLKAAITAETGITGITVGAATTTLDLSPTTSGADWAAYAVTTNLVGVNGTVTEAWDDTIAAVRTANDEWFVLNTETHTEAPVLLIAAYIESIKATAQKVYCLSSSDSAIKTSSTTDIFSKLKALNYDNTFYLYSGSASTFAECAFVGRFCPEQAGSNTWEQKTAIGLVADALTSAEVGYIQGKRGSTFETVGGVDIFVGGKVASGEWIDVIIFAAWLKTRIVEDLWTLLVNTRKLGYTAAGAAAIEGAIRKVMLEGIQVGGLASDPEPVVSVPNVLALSSAQRATRVLPNVTFVARLAGAIRAVSVAGTVYA